MKIDMFDLGRIPFLDNQLDSFDLRNKAVSSNIVEFGTPGYKRPDVNFEQEPPNAVSQASGGVARDIYEKFKSLKPNRLLFTKIDEAVPYVTILSLARDSRLPFSFVTNGKSVPDDIEPVSAKEFSRMVYQNLRMALSGEAHA